MILIDLGTFPQSFQMLIQDLRNPLRLLNEVGLSTKDGPAACPFGFLSACTGTGCLFPSLISSNPENLSGGTL